MNERLRAVETDVYSDPRYDEQTEEAVVRIEQVEPGTLGLGFDEFIISLCDDGTWYITERLGI